MAVAPARCECASSCRCVRCCRVKEAIELREAGFNHPITLLEGVITEEGARLASDYDLAVVIHDPAQLHLLRKVGLACWFKVETGMNRLGLLLISSSIHGDRSALGQLGLFSHFSDADAPYHQKNQDQRRRFDALRSRHGLPGGMSGSAAILRGMVQTWTGYARELCYTASIHFLIEMRHFCL